MSNENEFIKKILDDMNTELDDIAKEKKEENEYLKKKKDEYKNYETQSLAIFHMMQNNRIQMCMILLKSMGILFKYIGKTLSDKSDKTYVDKKSNLEDVERIRQEFIQQFKEQESKIRETIKPLSDEIKKTLERQERNKDVYK